MCAPRAAQRERHATARTLGSRRDPAPELVGRVRTAHRPLRGEFGVERTEQRPLLELGRAPVEHVGRAQHVRHCRSTTPVRSATKSASIARSKIARPCDTPSRRCCVDAVEQFERELRRAGGCGGLGRGDQPAVARGTVGA